MRTPLVCVLAFLLAVACGRPHDAPVRPAPSAAGPRSTPAPTPAPVAAPALRVDIVGASVSAGFEHGLLTGSSADNRTVSLQRVVRGWLGDTGAEIASRADLVMFRDAVGSGQQQINKVLQSPPDLLLAVDFLFWYGYGWVDAAGDEAAQRRARLQQGLDQLGRCSCPLLVGDLPDMHGASARMLRPEFVPALPLQEQLNEQIRAWAQGRANVRVFPVRRIVGEMKQQGLQLPDASGPLQVAPGGMLQTDRLHANRLGMAWLGFCMQDEVRQLLPAARAAALPVAAFEQFVNAAGAESEVADLRAAAHKR